MTEKSKLQEAIAGLEVRDGRRLYPGELKREILEYSHAKVAEGASKNAVALELGLSDCTLHRWHQQERSLRGGASKSEVAGFIEVTSMGAGGLRGKKFLEGKEEKFEVVCPSGFEVRVPPEFDVFRLRQLLGALEGR